MNSKPIEIQKGNTFSGLMSEIDISIHKVLEDADFIWQFDSFRLTTPVGIIYCYFDGKIWILRVLSSVIPFYTPEELQIILPKIDELIIKKDITTLNILNRKLLLNLK